MSNFRPTQQELIDEATMRIENPNVVGSGYIQFPPQRPFERPVQVQPPTVAVQEYQDLLGGSFYGQQTASQPTQQQRTVPQHPSGLGQQQRAPAPVVRPQQQPQVPQYRPQAVNQLPQKQQAVVPPQGAPRPQTPVQPPQPRAPQQPHGQWSQANGPVHQQPRMQSQQQFQRPGSSQPQSQWQQPSYHRQNQAYNPVARGSYNPQGHAAQAAKQPAPRPAAPASSMGKQPARPSVPAAAASHAVVSAARPAPAPPAASPAPAPVQAAAPPSPAADESKEKMSKSQAKRLRKKLREGKA
eukprot:CAMPEP_0177597004 /NCGR_PEP_ID=MMETSP0419_2-20121207/11459_1 /TAXON_ID=582737 /ORGANISM="Tetraselmis sp., Strain GSL018" /LENGTH=297 /DNA_ID=CAMNT_0019089103 /DNA_START=110 /DNA_END=1003 /DNA_ORIENTATION=-